MDTQSGKTPNPVDSTIKNKKHAIGMLSITKNRKSAFYLYATGLLQILYLLFQLIIKNIFAPSLLFSLLITLCTFILLPRNDVLSKPISAMLQKPKQALLFMALSCLFIALLFSEGLNDRSAFLSQIPRFSLQYIKSLLIALIILIGISAFFYAIFFKAGFSVALCATFLIVFSLVNHYILIFRDRTFLPHDFYSTQTAMNVISEYHLSVSPIVLASLQMLICLWIAALKTTPLLEKNSKTLSIKTRVVSLLSAVFVFAASLSTTFWNILRLQPQPWNPVESSTTNTFMLNFIATIPFSRVTAPQQYDQLKGQLEQQYPSQTVADSQKDLLPDKVIMLMNEAFTDFSMTEGFETNHDPLSFWHNLSNQEDVIQGNLVVNAFGGGTALSEFEALTSTVGVLTKGVTEGVMQRLVHDRIAGLPDSMKALGYQTIAMHPYTRSGWGRPSAYPYMGFDQFITLETMDFEKTDMIRSYATDEAFYRYITQVIDPIEEPVFLFGITIQNHGGYTWDDDVYNSGQLPVGDEIKILSPTGDFPQASQYLNLLHASDKAFEWLIDHYQNSEERVAVIMFGDHRPAITDGFEEKIKQMTNPEIYDFENHTVPYMVWANYPISMPQGPTDQISINYLSVLIKNVLSAPYTGFDQYLHELWNRYPVISAKGIIDSQGHIIQRKEFKSIPILNNYRVFQYNNLTGKKGYMDNLYLETDK